MDLGRHLKGRRVQNHDVPVSYGDHASQLKLVNRCPHWEVTFQKFSTGTKAKISLFSIFFWTYISYFNTSLPDPFRPTSVSLTGTKYFILPFFKVHSHHKKIPKIENLLYPIFTLSKNQWKVTGYPVTQVPLENSVEFNWKFSGVSLETSENLLETS